MAALAPARVRDIAAVVESALAGKDPGDEFVRLRSRPVWLDGDRNSKIDREPNAYARLFGTDIGKRAASAIGNESTTLDILSFLAIEVLYEYLSLRFRAAPNPGVRFVTVRRRPEDPPVLTILDSRVESVADTRRITDEIPLEPAGLVVAFDELRSQIIKVEPRLQEFEKYPAEAVIELFAIVQPEVVITRNPRMDRICAPSPFVDVRRADSLSSLGIYCKDQQGTLGGTACYHGTGPRGTSVKVGGVPRVVGADDVVQDIVFIPLEGRIAPSTRLGKGGIRSGRAPSEAEPVRFDGAGSGGLIKTRVRSHDAGLLRRRTSVQLKVQTPADTNFGDSGAALVDSDDRVVAFGFERTGLGEFPEFTDWIWADNALAALDLTPA
ncbi:hypothetical protein DSM104443_03192 [Usitatibacter rugosus]|uniref:Uncharacterized protein n=1 Tax=Usitatibacter rugosus TaxID=2732067 RepID=A0A6M4GYY7_9PROT|nr:hypothetical protein [Usitatibacter rugosus]QJR12108.1 hypothetical protein DSM104443_03192 [Usitatibacter rugosus]